MRLAQFHPGVRRPPLPPGAAVWLEPSPDMHAHLTAVVDREHLAPPVIGVMLDCGCAPPAPASCADAVIVAGPEGDVLLASFRPVPFADPAPGDLEPWQLALAVLDDAFAGDAPIDSLALFRDLGAGAIAAARQARRAGAGAASTFGVRRYSEALGAMGLNRAHAAVEGQVALEWNAIAGAAERGRYRHEISRASLPWQLDLRPAVRDAAFELIGGEPAASVSGRFQNTIAAAVADLVRGAACIHGRVPVVLAGSCFRGGGLGARVRRELAPDFQVIQEP